MGANITSQAVEQSTFQSLQGTIQTQVHAGILSPGFQFQSLQGTIQTEPQDFMPRRDVRVSIPSRYDPNADHRVKIDVQYALFQSLQGTIQTREVALEGAEVIRVSIPSRYDPNLRRSDYKIPQLNSFNPFKVRSKPLRFRTFQLWVKRCFNPFKVRSKLVGNVAAGVGMSLFQSLQGTIQTSGGRRGKPHKNLNVSIPSRYDPNNSVTSSNSSSVACFNPFKVRSKQTLLIPSFASSGFVSIPSRYDPNGIRRNRVQPRLDEFQSLQGTIQTRRAPN